VNTPHVTDSISSYALGCLDPDEAFQVEAHLAGCDTCRDELNAYRATAAQLALAAPCAEPPVSLRANILRSIQPVPGRKPVGAPGFSTRLLRWLQQSGPVWALASLVLVVVMVTGGLLLWNKVRSPQMGEFRMVAMAPTDAAPGASGVLVITQDGSSGTLVVGGLPVLDVGKQYQLWLIRDGQRSSGGVFSVTPGGVAGVTSPENSGVSSDSYGILAVQAARPLTDFSSFGITIEPAGGSPGPTGKKVLGGKS
jgi:anti-sigma-K factor RskA